MDAPFRYEDLPVFDAFERVSDPALYTPLPDDWHVGVADVVRSTEALSAGRYKAVNMAGAAVVGAVKNALAGAPFPFVFGGDGAVLAVAPEAAESTRKAMAATRRFVAEELGLTLRVGMLSVAEIRAAGHDLRVARYAASTEAIYAMFSGGGAAYAESELKAGRLALPEAPEGARPDLTGLSCRWAPIQSRHGVILSILVAPARGANAAAFREVAAEIIRLTQTEERAGHPLPALGPRYTLPTPTAMRTEAAASRRFPGHHLLTLARIGFEMAVAVALDRTVRKLGPLDVRRYRRWVTRNSDFRKFDDALRMTIDCTPGTADRLDAFLAEQEAKRIIDYGLHRQDAALITCIVPSVLKDDHLHFLDGAGGGYAFSAQALKERLALREAAMAAPAA